MCENNDLSWGCIYSSTNLLAFSVRHPSPETIGHPGGGAVRFLWTFYECFRIFMNILGCFTFKKSTTAGLTKSLYLKQCNQIIKALYNGKVGMVVLHLFCGVPQMPPGFTPSADHTELQRTSLVPDLIKIVKVIWHLISVWQCHSSSFIPLYSDYCLIRLLYNIISVSVRVPEKAMQGETCWSKHLLEAGKNVENKLPQQILSWTCYGVNTVFSIYSINCYIFLVVLHGITWYHQRETLEYWDMVPWPCFTASH